MFWRDKLVCEWTIIKNDTQNSKKVIAIEKIWIMLEAHHMYKSIIITMIQQ